MPAEWAAAATRAAANRAAPTPMPSSPKKVAASSLPPIKKQPFSDDSSPMKKHKVINAWGPGPKEREPLPEKFNPDTRKKFFSEKFMKDRLVERDFCHVRHQPYYKDLTRPEKETLQYLDYHKKEFWRTDVERVLRKDEDKRRARVKEVLEVSTSEEAARRQRAAKVRDIKYDAYLNLQAKMQTVGCRPNQSGAPHINIITRRPIDLKDHEDPPTYYDDVKKYKTAQRKLLLREKNSGARNFNILTWGENPPPPPLPEWPKDGPPPPPPPPPPTPPGTNSSKWAVSYGRLFGPFGVIDTN